MNHDQIHELYATSPRFEAPLSPLPPIILDFSQARPLSAGLLAGGYQGDPLGLAAHPLLVLMAAGLSFDDAMQRAQALRSRGTDCSDYFSDELAAVGAP